DPHEVGHAELPLTQERAQTEAALVSEQVERVYVGGKTHVYLHPHARIERMRRAGDGVKRAVEKRVKSRSMSGSEGQQGAGEPGRFWGSEGDPKRCPLCGEGNACGMAAGQQGDCWCKSVKIPAEVLERVPAAARDRACVCERCATGTRRALRVPVVAG